MSPRQTTLLLFPAAFVLAVMLVCGSATPARATPVREYLDEAQATTVRIELAGDQSAALGLIARTLADLDSRAALDAIARTRRPSDAARSLGVTAVALAPLESGAAADAAQAAGRLLMRIAEAEQRHLEQELLLWEIAVLGEAALSAAPEFRADKAQLAVVLGLAESDPAAALALMETWQLAGGPRDEAVAAIARQLAPTHPDQALELVTSMASARMRDFTLWRMAETRPAEESTNIALRIFDPLVRSSLTASAAAREAGDDPDAAQAAALSVGVARDSALAQLAVATAETDVERALSMARGLPERPRGWALARIALLTARETPALAESLLSEIETDAETVRVVLSRLAEAEPARALRLARSLPAGPRRDAALAAVVRALAHSDPELAEQLVWEMESPRWRARAVRPLAGSLAATDCDAATALLGLVLDAGAAGRIRADIAAVAAADDPELSARLLTSLPPSDYRNDAALEAAAVVLREGGPSDTAAQLASIGLSRDTAMRWLLPELARAQTRSPINLAEYIAEAFPRAIALVDVAREMLEVKSTARPAPDRARQIRPIVEWEGR